MLYFITDHTHCFHFFPRSYENNKLCTKGTQKDNDYREHHKND